jgi:hypothetical protein
LIVRNVRGWMGGTNKYTKRKMEGRHSRRSIYASVRHFDARVLPRFVP